MAAKLDFRPQTTDIFIAAGNSLRVTFVFTSKSDGSPYILDEYDVRAQYKPRTGRGESVDFDVTVVDNKVTLGLSPDKTRTNVKDNVWDLEISRPLEGFVYTLVGGNLTISPDVTKVV